LGIPLRVFVSSTMRDLENERIAVVRKLTEFNFTPVNAEAMFPSGADYWTVVSTELESCDVFLLIMGSSYGLVPDSGPMSNLGKSVTELEYDKALKLGFQFSRF
jgi:hypothetical protein